MNAVTDLAWLAAPAAALLAACALLVPLGRQVLARGVVFIDLAVAQVAALGVLVVGQGQGMFAHLAPVGLLGRDDGVAILLLGLAGAGLFQRHEDRVVLEVVPAGGAFAE